MKSPLKIKKIMTKNVITISSTETVQKASELMQKHKIGALIVVKNKSDKSVVGVLTERDILNKIVVKSLVSKDIIISEIMINEVVTIEEDLPYYEALGVMAKKGIKKIVVLDNYEDGNLVGILTETDILKLFSKQWANSI